MSEIYDEVNEFLSRIASKGPAECSEMLQAIANHPWRISLAETRLQRERNEAIDEAAELRAGKHQAYAERNKLVAWLAAIFPSTMCKTDIEGWDPEWHWCVYLDTPEGQMSWHIRESETELFDHVPVVETRWNGHTTYSKYARVGRLARFERRGGVEDD